MGRPRQPDRRWKSFGRQVSTEAVGPTALIALLAAALGILVGVDGIIGCARFLSHYGQEAADAVSAEIAEVKALVQQLLTESRAGERRDWNLAAYGVIGGGVIALVLYLVDLATRRSRGGREDA